MVVTGWQDLEWVLVVPTANDWLISPDLWLRPGTDNILSFYTRMHDGSNHRSI